MQLFYFGEKWELVYFRCLPFAKTINIIRIIPCYKAYENRWSRPKVWSWFTFSEWLYYIVLKIYCVNHNLGAFRGPNMSHASQGKGHTAYNMKN